MYRSSVRKMALNAEDAILAAAAAYILLSRQKKILGTTVALQRHETSTKWNAPRYHPLQGEPTVRGWKMMGSRSLTPKTRLGQHRCTHILTLSHFYFLLLKVLSCY
jgi:hypothetical protein